jgi:Protein of unknown function (DUF3052)
VGYDASCTLRIDGTAHKGTAWLEHKDLVFRGPSRLVIPLASISHAIADGNVLRVKFNGRVADLEIGDAAATKWAKRITNPPSRLDKLGVKPGTRVALVGLKDPAFEVELADREARVVRSAGSRARVDLLFYRAEHRDALEQLATLKRRIEPDGALWVVRPKGRAEITESETMAAGKRAGLVDVKVVSFSDADTAEKFVIPVAKRPLPAATPPRGSTPRASARRK